MNLPTKFTPIAERVRTLHQFDSWVTLDDAPLSLHEVQHLHAQGAVITAHKHVGNKILLMVKRTKADVEVIIPPPPKWSPLITNKPTEAQLALLQREYTAGVGIRSITERVNALRPSNVPQRDPDHLVTIANKRGWRRPPGFVGLTAPPTLAEALVTYGRPA